MFELVGRLLLPLLPLAYSLHDMMPVKYELAKFLTVNFLAIIYPGNTVELQWLKH